MKKSSAILLVIYQIKKFGGYAKLMIIMIMIFWKERSFVSLPIIMIIIIMLNGKQMKTVVNRP